MSPVRHPKHRTVSALGIDDEVHVTDGPPWSAAPTPSSASSTARHRGGDDLLSVGEIGTADLVAPVSWF